MNRDSKLWTYVFFATLIFSAFVLTLDFNGPWIEEDNYYGAIYAQAAHNNLRAGLLTTGGLPATLYFGPLPIPADAYYVHHPTLLPLLVTASFAMFGESEWTARLVPVTCSLLSLVLLWFLVRSSASRRTAAFVTAIFAAVPMQLHYGEMVDFEPCLTMIFIAALLCLRRWQLTGSTAWQIATALCCLLAMWMDWPGYLFVITLAGWLMIGATKKQPRFAIVLLALGTISGIGFLLQIRLGNPDAWSDLWHALTMRLSSGTDIGDVKIRAEHFTAAQWIRTVGGWMLHNYFAITWLLVLIGAARALTDKRFGPLGVAALVVSIAGALYVVVLKNESYIHDFASFYLLPAVAILAGLALDWLVEAFDAVSPKLAASAAIAALIAFGWCGYVRAENLRSPFYMLDGETPESRRLIPALGKTLAEIFPQNVTILCNFDPYGSVLPFYAQRMILNNLATYDDWQYQLAHD